MVKTARKEKFSVFNENNIFTHVKVYQLQTTETVNKDILMWLSSQTTNTNNSSLHIVLNKKFKVSKISSVERSPKLLLWFTLEEMRDTIVHRKLDQQLEISMETTLENLTFKYLTFYKKISMNKKQCLATKYQKTKTKPNKITMLV